MAESLTSAYVVHSLPGRLRLRIPGKRGDESYFSGLCSRLSNRREVAAISVNVATGGVLVHLRSHYAASDLAAVAEELSLFELKASLRASPPPVKRRSPLTAATAGFNGLDRLVLEATGGYLDLKSSLFLTLLAMAARQVVRGQFMVPGFTLVLQALNMMME